MNKSILSMASAAIILSIAAPSCGGKKAAEAEAPATAELAYSTECNGEENVIGQFPVAYDRPSSWCRWCIGSCIYS